MGKTSIEWTDASWNPIVGCTEISPGCANCYAARLAATRLRNTPQYKALATLGDQFVDRQPGIVHTLARTAPRWTGEVRFLPERLEEPLHWRKPRRIFVCDMGDLFHGEVQDEWIDRVYAMVLDCPQHTFQVLTKRAHRMRDYFCNLPADRVRPHLRGMGTLAWPVRNLWLGVSVENQHFADERIPLLLGTPAAVRWISAEPLLGPVDLKQFLRRGRLDPDPGLDWVVCGGESGPNARPMHPDWARSLRNQCVANGVPFFFKQWGEWIHVSQIEAALSSKEIAALSLNTRVRDTKRGRPELDGIFFALGKKRTGRQLDGSDWSQFPISGGRWRGEYAAH